MNFISLCRRGRFAAPVWLAVAALLALAGARPAAAQETAPSEYAVKAAFLFNFAKFVEWPAGTFAGGHTNLVIGVFGRSPFHGNLARIVAGRKIAGHPVVVRKIQSPPAAKYCQVLFVPASAKSRTRDVLAAVSGYGVLTVGESKDFAEAGGMINLALVDREVRFDINNAAAKAAGLKISSKLLTLARRLRNSP